LEENVAWAGAGHDMQSAQECKWAFSGDWRRSTGTSA